MWIQHHNGIFHSETGVDGWSQNETVDPSFGFAVAVHPERPGTAWFAPAIKDEYRYPKDGRLAVTRTTDGGKSFDKIGRAHVCTPVPNAHLVCRLLLEQKNRGNG